MVQQLQQQLAATTASDESAFVGAEPALMAAEPCSAAAPGPMPPGERTEASSTTPNRPTHNLNAALSDDSAAETAATVEAFVFTDNSDADDVLDEEFLLGAIADDYNAIDDSLADPQFDQDLTDRLAQAEARAAEAERAAADAATEMVSAAARQTALEQAVAAHTAQETYLGILRELDATYGGDLRAAALDETNGSLEAMGFSSANLPPVQLVKDRLEIAYLQLARTRAESPSDRKRPKAETLDVGVGGNAGAALAEGSLEEVVADMKRSGKLR